MNKLGLTQRQLDVLNYLKSLPDNEPAASYDEIADSVGMVKSNVHRVMHALRERGYVHFIEGKSRSWKLI